MTSRVQSGLLLVALAATVTGCENGRATSPTAPTPSTRPAATLSGLVFSATAARLRPVGGATVRLEIGSYRQDALTDQIGRYRLAAPYDGRFTVTTMLEGYDTDIRPVTVSGDAVLDIGLVARPYTLTGLVFEETATGRAPIADVEIYCDSCGSPNGHTVVYTDANGLYSLAWTYNGANPLFVTKANYEIADPKLKDEFGRVTPIVRGDTRFDVQLARP